MSGVVPTMTAIRARRHQPWKYGSSAKAMSAKITR